MSDLISRSALIEAINKSTCHYTDIWKRVVCDVIGNQPTAFDVDKVVADVRTDCYSMGLDESQTEIIVNDIVKRSGVDEKK